jgi:hypothetical protein
MSGSPELLLAGFLAFSPHLALENSNIGGYQDDFQVMDYNRFRVEISLEHQQYSNFYGLLLVDNETLFTASPDSLYNTTSLYRAYLQYRGEKHFWTVGRQRIPLGVGRIWNPVDVFNPIDVEAIEPNEREGTDAVHYEYALSELANLEGTVAKGKGTVRLKGFFDFADIALVAVRDDDNDLNSWGTDTALDIIGWELEGELLSTGIELRGEGGSFHNRDSGDRYTDFIAGGEYGFANSLTLLAEYHFSGQAGSNELAVQAGFQPSMLWTCSLVVLASLDDHSTLVSPAMEYSLSDEMTLEAGAFLYSGSDYDAFGWQANRYFLRWFVHL